MYFFTDIQKLPDQLIGDSYGPVNTDPTNKYNVTSKFSLSATAKVFACVDANMIVQQSDVDDSLVNLILKPRSELNVPIDVEFYVYRGVLKSSLIDEQNNLAQLVEGSSNDLIKRIWKKPPTDFSCGTFGYDNNIDGNVDIADIYDCLFDVDYIYVKEGEWIGTFTDNSNDHKIGFEVILKTNRFKVDVNYVRKGEHVVDVSGLSSFNEKIKREEILNFLDPAALYGRHFNEKVDFFDTTQNKKLTTTIAPGINFIYTKLIEKFYTKNRLYLDIRSEKGYSYNFYRNYNVSDTDLNSIQIRHAPGTGTFTSQKYQTNNWPIVFIESQHPNGNENTLRLKLRINDNTRPILYLNTKKEKNKIKVTDGKTDYFKTDTLVKNGNTYLTEWTNEFSLKLPNTQSETSRNYICSYVKMNYFRTIHNATLPNTVLKNQYYYDSAFCSIDLPNIGNPNINSKQVESADPIYVREPNNENSTGNFQLNMINGAYWNGDRILFYSTIQYENSSFTSEKEYLNTYSQKLDLSTPYNGSKLRERTEIICRGYEIESNNTIRIPGINFFKSNDLGGEGSSQKNHKENAMLLGLTIDQLNSINNNAELDNRHHRFIHLEPHANNPLTTVADTNNDNTTYRYYRYTLQLQGLNATGNRDIVTPQHNNAPIIVYSRDNQFFSSADFSANEPLTTGQNGQNQINQVEFHIYHDGVVKINDNIDFALIHDIQNIWLFYHGENNTITEITNLNIILINKMGKGQQTPTITTIPNGYTSTIDYTPYNSIGVDAKTSYIYPGYVITEGSKYGQSHYKIKYNKLNKKIFMFELDDDLNVESLNMRFEFVETRRFYCALEVTAAFFGSLVEIGSYSDSASTIPFVIKSTGSSYEDGTGFPSLEHNNGDAIDTKYQTGVTGLTNAQKLARDQAFVNAMRKFGATKVLRGTGTHYSTGLTNATNGGELHNSHLHCGVIVLKNGNKTL